MAYYDGKIYVGGWSNLYCLDALSGEILWQYELPGNANDVTVYNDVVYTSTDHKIYNSSGADTSDVGWIYAFNKDTGDTLWTLRINDGIGSLDMAPVIEDDILYIGTSWRKPFGVQAFDINTREELWHDRMPNYEFICDHGIIAGDVLVLSLAWYAIGGWDKKTGERLWITWPSQNYNWSRVCYDGRYVYYSHGWIIRVIEPETGEIVYSKKGPEGEPLVMISIGNRKIFVQGGSRLMAFELYDPEDDPE